MKKFIENIERRQVKFSEWISAFFCVVLIRYFIESFSNPSSSGNGNMASDLETFAHYSLFFLASTVGLVLIVHFLSKKGTALGPLSIATLPIIWLGPLLDFVISGGRGMGLSYLSTGIKDLILNYLTFFGPNLFHGATLGIRIEILIIISSIGWYVWYVTGKFWKSLAGFILSYSYIFFLGVFPTIVYIFSKGLQQSFYSSGYDIYIFFEEMIRSLSIAGNVVYGSAFGALSAPLSELGFDLVMSRMFFLILCVVIFWWFRSTNRKILQIVLSNSRPERVGFYVGSVVIGFFYAYTFGLPKITFIDIVGLICLLVAWYSAWMYAVHVNDPADIEGDLVTNINRPLIKKDLAVSQMKDIGYLWLLLAIMGAWSAGYFSFYFILIFLACSYVYSSGFVRLKMYTMLSSFLIGLASLSGFMAGFFYIYPNKVIGVISPLLVSGLVVMFALGSNIRDIKDIEGDKISGIKTIPVVFGRKNGIKIVGALAALSFLSVPLFLSIPLLFVISVPTAVLCYFLTTRKKFNEKHIFILYFCFILVSMIFFW